MLRNLMGYDGNVVSYYSTDLNGDGAYGKDDLNESPLEQHVDPVSKFESAYPGASVNYLKVFPEQKLNIVLQNENIGLKLTIESEMMELYNGAIEYGASPEDLDKPSRTMYGLTSNNGTTMIRDIMNSSGCVPRRMFWDGIFPQVPSTLIAPQQMDQWFRTAWDNKRVYPLSSIIGRET
ncbi:MAG: hypothetical protein HWE22_14650 [Flavobacteriales bacterium]|nr:hypothetical protein [Flavobacteriales bacterium]